MNVNRLIAIGLLCAITLLPCTLGRTETVIGGNDLKDQQIFGYCEMLRMGDSKIVKQGVDGLFKIGGLQALTILHLKWIAEQNPEIRNHILSGFSKIGDHRFIADPDFPKEWIRASKRFLDPERETRLRELRRYFPKDMERAHW
jgi:hypothetical protein